MAESHLAKLPRIKTKKRFHASRTSSCSIADNGPTPLAKSPAADPESLLQLRAADLEPASSERAPLVGVRESRNGRTMMPSDVLSPLANLPPQPPRIAIKSKGKILLLNPADILSVEAEGNYVSLSHRSECYLLRESISAMAEKLKLYGFVRIHRSVLVNAAHVEEIYPGATGEYVLRLSAGKQFVVSRTYKRNLRALAQSWIGLGSFVDD